MQVGANFRCIFNEIFRNLSLEGREGGGKKCRGVFMYLDDRTTLTYR